MVFCWIRIQPTFDTDPDPQHWCTVLNFQLGHTACTTVNSLSTKVTRRSEIRPHNFWWKERTSSWRRTMAHFTKQEAKRGQAGREGWGGGGELQEEFRFTEGCLVRTYLTKSSWPTAVYKRNWNYVKTTVFTQHHETLFPILAQSCGPEMDLQAA